MATLSVGGSLVTTNDTLSNGVQDNITRLGTVTAGIRPGIRQFIQNTTETETNTGFSAGTEVEIVDMKVAITP